MSMASDSALTKTEKRLETLADTTEKQKKALVTELRKTPIVQIACDRVGVGRSTYYKWRAKDSVFARAASRAIEAGRFRVNDIAESHLMKLIQDYNLTAIIFWLKHNHPKYATVNRIIHEYEVATEKPSVEESNIAADELGKMIARKVIPNFTIEEVQEHIEEGLDKQERNKDEIEREQAFDEEPEKPQLSP